MWWSSWWLIWIVFMVMLGAPVGYGWGYRGWGAPYPSYVQRRRQQQAAATGTSSAFDYSAWGFGGDFVWIVLAIGFVWTGWALLFR